jgi:hypothetical protein
LEPWKCAWHCEHGSWFLEANEFEESVEFEESDEFECEMNDEEMPFVFGFGCLWGQRFLFFNHQNWGRKSPIISPDLMGTASRLWRCRSSFV